MEEPSINMSTLKRMGMFILYFIAFCVIFAALSIFGKFFGFYGLLGSAVLAAAAVYFTYPKKKDG